jgi:hypothetical protein
LSGVFGGGFVSSALSSIALNLGSTLIMSAFQDAPSSGGASNFQSVAAGRQQMFRSSVANRRVIYGTCKVSGPIIYATTSDYAETGDNKYIWLVIPLAGHEVQAIDDVFFNDDAIPNAALNGVGQVISGKYAGYAGIIKHLGGSGQVVDTSLNIADPVNWDSTKVGNGVAYIVVWLLWDREIFSAGLPNISALVRGKKLYDPRDSGTRYSANWALVVRDYLTNSDYGLNCSSTEINDASFIAAANICDERVLMPAVSPTVDVLFNTFTGATGTNYITATGFKETLQTGDGVYLYASAPLPAPLTQGLYYWIRVQEGIGQLATTAANAFAGSNITITADGAGSMAYYDQARYEAQGTLDTGTSPMSFLKSLLPAGAGTLVWQQGEFLLYAGAYRSPSGTLTAADLRGSIEILAQPPRRDLFNLMRGVYSDPNSSYQPIDFAVRSNSTYETQDSERIPRDIALPFTTNEFRAQRIAEIFLQKSRQGISVTMPCKPTAMAYAVGDTVRLTFSELGWSLKEFVVTSWTLSPDGGVDLTLQEEASTVYTWTPSSATVYDSAPDTNLANPDVVNDIAGLALSSGTTALFVAEDGTVHSRILVEWTPVVNSFVTSGGFIDIEYTKTTDTDWQKTPQLPGDASQAYISNVIDSTAYYVRVRAVSATGARGDWTTSAAHTVVGKTEPPTAVTNASVNQVDSTIVFSCSTVTDVDLSAIEIRYSEVGGVWADASPVTYILKGETSTAASIPPGSWVFFFRSVDTSGNYSTSYSTVTFTVTNQGYVGITQITLHPDWYKASLVDCVEHWTGVITPTSIGLVSSQGWETFDNFVYDAPSNSYIYGYTIDTGISSTKRIYGDIVSVLGPGVSGTAQPRFKVALWSDGEPMPALSDLSVGTNTFRYVYFAAMFDSNAGEAVISQVTLTIDGLQRTETGSETTSGAGSVAVTFDTPFNTAPILQLTPSGTGDVTASYSSLTTTGFTAHFKSGGVTAAGTVHWTATGV